MTELSGSEVASAEEESERCPALGDSLGEWSLYELGEWVACVGTEVRVAAGE